MTFSAKTLEKNEQSPYVNERRFYSRFWRSSTRDRSPFAFVAASGLYVTIAAGAEPLDFNHIVTTTFAKIAPHRKMDYFFWVYVQLLSSHRPCRNLLRSGVEHRHPLGKASKAEASRE